MDVPVYEVLPNERGGNSSAESTIARRLPSTDPDGDPLSFTWDFGDGTSESGMTLTHTYTMPGTFNATVTVSDGSLSDTASVEIRVRKGKRHG